MDNELPNKPNRENIVIKTPSTTNWNVHPLIVEDSYSSFDVFKIKCKNLRCCRCTQNTIAKTTLSSPESSKA